MGALLLTYLADKPFQYYKDITANQTFFTFGKGLSGTSIVRLPFQTEKRADGFYHITDYPQQDVLSPSSPSFGGKLFVLFNGSSFSTTAEVMTHLSNTRRAEFIGEEGGGAYDGNNAGTMAEVVLPNSQMKLLVPLMSFYLPVNQDQAGSRGIVPNYEVHYSIEDYLTNPDKEMALAFEKAE